MRFKIGSDEGSSSPIADKSFWAKLSISMTSEDSKRRKFLQQLDKTILS